MLIYKDVISGDEMLSDSFPTKVIDDVVFEVTTRLITISNDVVGVEDNAEEGEGGLADGAEQKVDVVHAFRLNDASFTKAEFIGYIKMYLKKIKDHLTEKKPDRVDPFMKAAQAFVKKVLGRFDDLRFWVGESMNYEAGVVMGFYPEGAMSPTLWFWMDGMREEKC